jgi:hypothetical protein
VIVPSIFWKYISIPLSSDSLYAKDKLIRSRRLLITPLGAFHQKILALNLC